MFGFQQKITEDAKRQKNQFEQTKPASEPYSIMTQILELSKWEYKGTMNNMLRALKKKQIVCKNTWVL